MSSQTVLAIVAGLGGAILAGPAVAGQEQARPNADGYNAGERICEKLTVVGSRLAVKKVCMTRAQWDERRREDRDAIDQAQRSPCVIQSTGSRGNPSC